MRKPSDKVIKALITPEVIWLPPWMKPKWLELKQPESEIEKHEDRVQEEASGDGEDLHGEDQA